MPARLADALAKGTTAGQSIANLPDRAILPIVDRLSHFEVRPVESEGWSKAEVTVGGIDTDLLSSKTMEARSVRGLYAIGEAVDVTGWLGGYNFQWAWSSGWCAGSAV
jgi:predicted flavoprotein YhiN